MLRNESNFQNENSSDVKSTNNYEHIVDDRNNTLVPGFFFQVENSNNKNKNLTTKSENKALQDITLILDESIETNDINNSVNIDIEQDTTREEKIRTTTKRLNNDFSSKSSNFWELPHRRYDFDEYSREIVGYNPNSYHRLVLAIQDTNLDDEHSISQELPKSLQKKMIKDQEDIEFIKLNARIQKFYKKLYKSVDLSIYSKKEAVINSKEVETFERNNHPNPSATSRSLPVSVNSRIKGSCRKMDDNNKKQVQFFSKPSSSSTNRQIDISYRPEALSPIRPLSLTRTRKDVVFPKKSPTRVDLISNKRQSSIIINKDSNNAILKDFCPTRIVNQHNLKEQTKLKLYRSPKVELITPKGYNFDESKIKKQ